MSNVRWAFRHPILPDCRRPEIRGEMSSNPEGGPLNASLGITEILWVIGVEASRHPLLSSPFERHS
jgi:hypothetical protein